MALEKYVSDVKWSHFHVVSPFKSLELEINGVFLYERGEYLDLDLIFMDLL